MLRVATGPVAARSDPMERRDFFSLMAAGAGAGLLGAAGTGAPEARANWGMVAPGPVPPAGFDGRLLVNKARAYEVMEREGLDGIVALNPVNVFYLGNYLGYEMQKLRAIPSFAVMPRDPKLPSFLVVGGHRPAVPRERRPRIPGDRPLHLPGRRSRNTSRRATGASSRKPHRSALAPCSRRACSRRSASGRVSASASRRAARRHPSGVWCAPWNSRACPAAGSRSTTGASPKCCARSGAVASPAFPATTRSARSG